jgi:uncharacterized protein (DUF2147 family)
MKCKSILIILMLTMYFGLAQSSPIGLWKTIDDETKIEKSYVRISSDSNGLLVGRVEKIFNTSITQKPTCEKCTDERKGQAIIGMIILRNARLNPSLELWEGGDILDPQNGKVYRSRLRLINEGKTLEVRGYIGPFFRNQQWDRVE